MQGGVVLAVVLGLSIITGLRPIALQSLLLTVLRSPLYLILYAIFGIIAYHIIEYLRDPYEYNSPESIPGPWIAKLSYVWLARKAALGNRSGEVHELHRKYGKLVRIAPNHISIAEPEALYIIYAHVNGGSKSDFYDVFVSLHRGLFSTRDRAEHARKRKLISSSFSQKNLLEFEPYIQNSIALLISKWDSMTDEARMKTAVPTELMTANGAAGKVVHMKKGAYALDGKVFFDVLPCEFYSFVPNFTEGPSVHLARFYFWKIK